MKLASFIVAGCLSLGAASAFATDTPLGDVTAAGGFSAASGPLSGAFSDTYDFSLTGTNELSDSWTNSWTSQAGSIANFTATLTGPNGFSDVETATTSGHSQFISAYYPTLAPGDYVLTISGVASGKSTYGGSLSVSAVPEPASISLLLAGLGLMGVAAKRRKL
jgi:hypothetical protein